MTAARHARDGQYHDDTAAWLADTWVLIRLSWLLLTILISRRVPRAAGGVTATPPAEAPGVPAVDGAPVRPAGTPPRLPDAAPGEVTAPAAPGAAARPPWATWQDPPGTRGQHPFDAPVSFPRGQLYRHRPDGIIVNRGTGQIDVVPDVIEDAPLVPRWYLAHLARQDAGVIA